MPHPASYSRGFHYDPVRAQAERERAAYWRDRIAHHFGEDKGRKASSVSCRVQEVVRRFAQSRLGRFFFQWMDVSTLVYSLHTTPFLCLLDRFLARGRFQNQTLWRKDAKSCLRDVMQDWQDRRFRTWEGDYTLRKAPAGYFKDHWKVGAALSLTVFALTTPLLVITLPGVVLDQIFIKLGSRFSAWRQKVAFRHIRA